MSPQPARNTVRVCLLDEHRILCQALAEFLRQEPDIEVVAACHHSADALDVCQAGRADLLLLDLHPESPGFDLLAQLQECGFPGKVVVLAAGVGDHDVVRLTSLGVSGMILKDAAPDRLVRCVREVSAGQLWFDAEQMRRILGKLAQRNGHSVESGFTDRERKVLRMLLDGASNKEIAAHLKIGVSTVKFLFQTLFRKTGVHTRSQLVRVVLERHRAELLI